MKDQTAVEKKQKKYGDRSSDDKDHTRKKKMEKVKAKMLMQSEGTSAQKVSGVPVHSSSKTKSELTKNQKKKLRKLKKKAKLLNEKAKKAAKKSIEGEKKSGTELHLERMDKELGLSAFKREIEMKKEKEKEPEICSETPVSGPEVFVFKKHKKNVTVQEGSSEDEQEEDIESQRPVFDLKQSRYEVQRLAIQGISGAKKNKASVDLLVQLGAKPEKQLPMNYKEYQKMQRNKMKREQEMKKHALAGEESNLVKKTTSKKKRKRDRNDVGLIHVDGQAGKYRGGVQVISKRELKGIQKSSIQF